MSPVPLRLSIIVPCWNDLAALTESLPVICGAILPGEQVILADASPGGECADFASTCGVTVIRCHAAGRGPQMNAGAAAATGDVLLFTHADTTLTAAHLDSLRSALAENPALVAGAFYKDTRAHYPLFAWADSVIRFWMRRCGILYGDQSIFVRSAHFRQLGGWAPVPLMEDVEMSGRLRRAGGVTLLDPPLRTSMRRFRRHGYLRTRLRNVFYVWAFRCGVSPARIYRWYYGRPPA